MRRAAVRAFRTARLVPSRNLAVRNRNGFQSSNHVLGIRFASSKQTPITSKPPQSMFVRRFSVAFISGLVGYGAWYTYKGNGTEVIGQDSGAAQQARGLSTSAVYSLPNSAETAVAERKAVIIGADELYTGAIQGDGPISKATDDAGRKVLEMLTPE